MPILVTKRYLRLQWVAVAVVVTLVLILPLSHYNNTKSTPSSEHHQQQHQQPSSGSEHKNEQFPHLQQPSRYGDDESVSNSNSNSNSESYNYDWITQLISNNNPHLTELLTNYPVERAKQRFVTDKDHIFSKSYLSSLLEIDNNATLKLQSSHSNVVKSIKALDTATTARGERTFGPVTSEQGIVIVGGGKFSWLALPIITHIRSSVGSKVPIEVFIATEEEYDEHYCNVVLPSYDAECSYLPDSIPGGLEKMFASGVAIPTGFQYKILAILVSKFEKILFLDADNAPLFDPVQLLQSDVFQEKGFVVWPDPWTRTTNPAFYDIAGLEVSHNEIVRGFEFDSKRADEPKVLDYDTDVTYHDLKGTLPNPSSESGMLLLNKRTHVKTLLLCLYYNIYGPGMYYPLLTQGGAGEGDKETFLAAAFVLNETYYQVQTMLQFIGYFDKQNGFHSKALGQKDPMQDYANFQQGYRYYTDLGENMVGPRVFFMHLSYPKLTPYLLFVKKPELHPIDPQTGESYKTRLYGGSTANELGYDFELRVFEMTTALMCGTDGIGPVAGVVEGGVGRKMKYFAHEDLQKYCPLMEEHVDWLRHN